MKARGLGSVLCKLVGLTLLVGCSEAEVVAELHSLQGSEDAVFVCRDGQGLGHAFSECPDRNGEDDEDKAKDLSVFALVSQTVTNEVAVIDVTRGQVVDVDKTTPGFGFLRVGGRPVAMAATPGGSATFVATADVGHNGIFALPTECIDAPNGGEPVRDLTSWSACRLDSAPGEMAVVVEPPSASDGSVFSDCAGTTTEPELPAVDPEDDRCTANLQTEAGPKGRRKLLVSLPDKGQLVVIDAQTLLNNDPGGTFPDCQIEQTLALDVNVPSTLGQALPADLTTTCSEEPPPSAPQPSRRAPRPAGFALSDDRLYVADQAAPVIHVVDTTSVCNVTELPSLLPLSLREPARVVTTRRVALSPLTPSGKRYVYAIDAEDQPGASVMAFDVSPGSTDPTPIVRPGSPELPGERPDRLSLGSSAKDITFAYRDLPYVDPATGVGEFGTLCDPRPSAALESPGALARPASDFQAGARPGLLRGLFGFILLTNGTIAVVDVEDFDAPCRRPKEANPASTPDFRGCVGDPDVGSFVVDDASTVTGEVSCRVVQPHRFRGATLAINDPEVGVRAPSLRGFPQLTLPLESAKEPVENRPRLLGVPFAGVNGEPVAADVYVGSTRHSTAPDSDDQMPVDPNGPASEGTEALNSLVLPPLQPRAYAGEDSVTLVYEGSYAGDRTAGFFKVGGELRDSSLSFCAAGVYDQDAMADYGASELGLTSDEAAEFAQQHSDYVQVISGLLKREDGYWSARAGIPGALTYDDCSGKFGAEDAEKLLEARDFQVLRAFADHLELASVSRDGTASFAEVLECFPAVNRYRLRTGKHWALSHAATGFNHDIITAADQACVRSCSPLKKWAKSRVFEISSSSCREATVEGDDPLQQRVGCALPGEVACVYDQSDPDGDEKPDASAAVTLHGPASACIFAGLTERFALYRGRLDSPRDAVFTWQTTGGFAPLLMSLANLSNAVSPQTIQFLQSPEQLAVVDGSSLGLSLFSLDTFGVARPSPFY